MQRRTAATSVADAEIVDGAVGLGWVGFGSVEPLNVRN